MGRRKTVKDRNKDLQIALRRLDPDQGPRARANAREAVVDALRELRATVDRDYPHTRKRKPRAKLQPGHKENRLRSRGWVPVPHNGKSAALAASIGIKGQPDPRGVASLQERARRNKVKVPTAAECKTADVWVPRWVSIASRVGVSKADALAAKKSPTKRRSLLAQAMLTADDDDLGFTTP